MMKRPCTQTKRSKPGIRSDPDPMLPEIVYCSHRETARDVCSLFPGLEPEQLPKGMG